MIFGCFLIFLVYIIIVSSFLFFFFENHKTPKNRLNLAKKPFLKNVPIKKTVTDAFFLIAWFKSRKTSEEFLFPLWSTPKLNLYTMWPSRNKHFFCSDGGVTKTVYAELLEYQPCDCTFQQFWPYRAEKAPISIRVRTHCRAKCVRGRKMTSEVCDSSKKWKLRSLENLDKIS